MLFKGAYEALSVIMIEAEYRAWTQPYPTGYCKEEPMTKEEIQARHEEMIFLSGLN